MTNEINSNPPPIGHPEMFSAGLVPCNPLQPQIVKGEARIRDLDLAARLGFVDPHMIRRLIERHSAALADLGVSVTVTETSGSKGGRPGKVHYLNRKQAIFITAKSETPTATDITIEIIERFDAYERGESMPPPDPMAALNDPFALRALLLGYAEKQASLMAQIEAVAPKTVFYDRFLNAEGLYGLQNAGRSLGLSPNKFIGLLKQGYLFYQGGNLIAKQVYITQGLFEMKSYTDELGKNRLQSFLTPKGLNYFSKKFGLTPPPVGETH